MSDDIFNGIPEILAAKYTRISDKYIMMIAKKLREIGSVNATDVHTIFQFSLYGADVQKLEKELTDLTNMTVAELYYVMERVADKSITASQALADLRGVKLQPLKYDPFLQRTVTTLSNLTAGTFENISNTTAVGVRFTDQMGNVIHKTMEQAYRDAIDEAIHHVTMGLEGYDRSIARVMKQFIDSGLRYVDYESGYSRRLDSAVRQNVLDGMRSVYQGVQNELGKEFGADGIELSAHGTCAPDHLPFQGRQYTDEQFERIQNELPRPFGFWNCRHSWWKIIVGVSQPAYSESELRALAKYSNEEIEFEGKTMTRYEATQKMRQIETNIRRHKDNAVIDAELGNDSARRAEQYKINLLKAQYEALVKTFGLVPEPDRMTVRGFRPVKVK